MVRMPSLTTMPKRIADLPARAEVIPDLYRTFVFPNRIREQRRHRGLQKLMALSVRLPDIPYIRLSKIERGEVVARADEIKRIARELDLAPADLLTDVTDPEFDIARWAQPFQDGRPVSAEEERFAILLAAALRVLRNGDATLTIAALDQEYALPPVILSRLENAHKTFDRWNDATAAAVCRLFGVADESALRKIVQDRYRSGELDAVVWRVADPDTRALRSRERIAALSAELALSTRPARRASGPPTGTKRGAQPELVSLEAAPSLQASSGQAALRELTVFGTPFTGGIIAFTPTEDVVEAPRRAGARAFALRVCRATLGAGLPASAIVIADPDHRVTVGGLAAVRTAEGYRLVSVTFDRTGATKGYSVAPDLELDLDALDPADVVAVIEAVYP
ncbi:helix-turn-helix domain-containing protein [Sphingomonas sp. PAMC 26621]|uniref:helix-turn-helix domain-containing protein n=1 Tax=Sphingomonas sp. PAMC 26621 TaxID=1112213 RepID=UPI001EE66D8C|nr:helix-turn-helix transcriptional regulator [Sphingomonas sp. PAMC 26621]